MTRIAIIGNAGGGKSTISRKLRDRLGLPLHAIDQLQWRPGWVAVPKVEFAEAHASLLAEPRWIMDGWGDFGDIEKRFDRADTIVLVDYPLWRHYGWALKRQFMCLFRPRIDGPPGCPMIPKTWPLLKMLWAIDRHAMPRLRVLVHAQSKEKRVFHLRTLNDLVSFYREVERHALSITR
jgi:adenylate kinase family enzyme